MKKMLPRLRLPSGQQTLGTPWLLGLGFAFALAAVAAGVLGLIGILSLNAEQDLGLNPWQVAYGVIQLYTAKTPSWVADDADVPTSYDMAKVIAPMSTAYAFTATAAILFSERWRLLRARRAREHSIVCGGGRSGVFLSRALALTGTTVFIDHDASGEGVATSLVRGVIPLSGDARDAVVQLRAGLPRAKAVFAVADTAEVNAAVATSVRGLLGDRKEPLDCYAVIDDAELQVALQARILSTGGGSGFRLHLLERDQLFASAVVRADPPDPRSDTVVVGSGPLAVALVVEAARPLIAAAAVTGRRPRLFVAGPHAQNLLAEAAGRLAGLEGCLEMRVAGAGTTGETQEATAGVPGPLDTVYVCGPSDSETIKVGFTWLNAVTGIGRRVVFCVQAETGLADTLTPAHEEVPDQAGNLIRIHSRTLALADPDHLRSQSLTEKLARAFHAEYVAHMDRTAAPDPSGASLQPWDHLPELLKNSNRDQATQIARKLELLRCFIVPVDTSLPAFALTDDEIEQLARAEHERWQAEREREGIRYAPERTPQTHPDLVAWEQLTEAAREKDRIFIRALPSILAREGLIITRLPLGAGPRPVRE